MAAVAAERGQPRSPFMMRRSVFMMWIGLLALLPWLAGCTPGFFPPVDNSSGGGGSTTGNTVYIANQTTSSIGGFSIGTGTLTSLSGLPFAAGYLPLSLTVTPKNTFLYVGGVSGIYCYVINSSGTVSAPASTGAIQAVAYARAMTVSPDGQWLIVLDGSTQQLDIFQINSSTCALTSVNASSPPVYSVQSGVWQPTAVTVSPNGAYIFAALGTGGDAVFTFNTSTGAAASQAYLPTGNAATGDYGLAVDPNSAYLYIARSGTNGGVAVYSIGSNGTLTAVKGSPFAAGSGTYSVVMNSTGSYVYAANRADGTISGFTVVAATTTTPLSLTAISGSPFASGTTVQSLGIDSTGKYLLAAAAGGSADLTMYSFDATVAGKLDQVTTAATDSDPAGASALALTH